ncbi:transglycosylase domain-containing protein [Lentibacillus amyloliquefaciens]|uniref:Penicillin-binding protein n=1 Tax=Lentibacillus amyloliquefaciens TaxID=1472767 RepID=A0A0U4FBR4_9BACI|nr:penicillin-binding protein 1A [Lentibacillus amyloliquefaciens]ALX47933.1 penicillin-binding protein [Lentibacillus amyloliquefaciens]
MATNGQSRTARRKQKKSAKKPLWKKLFMIIGIAILVIGIGVGALFTYYIVTAPEIDASKLDTPYSSKIYDKDGELFAELGAGEQRTQVEYDELPQVLVDAVLSTEDARFFDHPGVDIWRVGGAVVANITDGFGSEGASTITQQVIEKSFLSPEKKISIKVQEMWLALQLEREYSKEEILEMYLNKIYYGNRAYGVAKAAELYFGKTDLSELTLPEAAILAGLPQRPSAYNPFKNPDLMKDRMNTVLNLMVKNDKISESEAEEARQVDIPSLLTDDTPDPTPYQAFLDQVKKEVEEKVEDADIYTDGLNIHTTIDTDAQEHVEYLLSDSEDNPINYPEPVTNSDGEETDMEAGMTVLDTKTGAIRAIGGARGGLENGGLNYATGISRQPASTFKPIIDYAPAIENNQWSTYHQLNDDGPYDIAGSDARINTWAGQYYGWVSMRYALQQSLNVPAAKTFEEIGASNAIEFAENLGISIGDTQVGVTDAIGGGKIGTNPLELAGAYRAFGNGGVYNEPYAVTKVEFPDSGRTVDLTPEPEAAMSESTAYMITDMLQTAISEGTGAQANVPGLPDAGKTGTTTHDEVEGSPDSWFSGYTTDYTISIWTGYDDNSVTLPDTKIPHALYKNTMSELSKDIDTPDFTQPDSVVEAEVEKGSRPAKKPSEYTPESQIVTELFVKGQEPSETSEQFDQLDPVEGLEATYDEGSDSIQVEWDYSSDASFEVSASVDGGQMQSLSSTEDTSMEISSVEPGATYEIQVVATSGSNTSEPATTTVEVPGDEENEDGGNIPAVSGLNANVSGSNIDVSWQYDGPPAQFEVAVSQAGSQLQTQTVDSAGIVIEGEGVQPGQTYTITVTPVGQDGDNQGVRGESSSTEATIPGEPDSGGTENDGNNNGNENGENNDGDGDNGNNDGNGNNGENGSNGGNGGNGDDGGNSGNNNEGENENPNANDNANTNEDS